MSEQDPIFESPVDPCDIGPTCELVVSTNESVNLVVIGS